MIAYSQLKKAKEENVEFSFRRVASPLPSGILDILNRMLGMLPMILIALGSEYVFPMMTDYMNNIDELDFSWNGWIAKIALRDLIINLSIGSFWYYCTMLTDMKEVASGLKFNEKDAGTEPLLREILNSISTTLMGTFFEVLAIMLYSQGYFSRRYENYMDRPWITAAWILLIPFWRDAHFYWVHRAMHPWNTKYMPDVGAFLFKYGHYLHH